MARHEFRPRFPFERAFRSEFAHRRYHRGVNRLLETIGGACELFRLGCLTGFRFSGSYWTWRLYTAFGRGKPPRNEMFRAVLDYGCWMRRMRTGK